MVVEKLYNGIPTPNASWNCILSVGCGKDQSLLQLVVGEQVIYVHFPKVETVELNGTKLFLVGLIRLED